MSNDDGLKALYAAHRSGYEKFVYFLMAASGACIGFALTQHKEPTGFDGELLLCALSCWGGSFYFGLRSIDQLLHGLKLNIVHLDGDGRSPDASSKVSKLYLRADRAHRIQIAFLMLGVGIYIYSRFQEIIWQLFL